VQRAPGIPHALDWAEGFWQSSGALASRGANARPSLRGAKRRSNPLFLSCCAMDCFASLAMTAGNDGLLRGACHRARIRATCWLAMTAGAMDCFAPLAMTV
jgi:hypothetical protein